MADAAYNSGSHPRATGKCNENSSAFIAALLAPLPAGEEAVDTPAFRRVLAACGKVAWDEGMRLVTITHARWVLEDERMRRLRRLYDDASLAARWAYHDAIMRQCAIPATTQREWRWKVTNARKLNEPLSRGAQLQMAVDARRFGAKVAA